MSYCRQAGCYEEVHFEKKYCREHDWTTLQLLAAIAVLIGVVIVFLLGLPWFIIGLKAAFTWYDHYVTYVGSL